MVLASVEIIFIGSFLPEIVDEETFFEGEVHFYLGSFSSFLIAKDWKPYPELLGSVP